MTTSNAAQTAAARRRRIGGGFRQGGRRGAVTQYRGAAAGVRRGRKGGDHGSLRRPQIDPACIRTVADGDGRSDTVIHTPPRRSALMSADAPRITDPVPPSVMIDDLLVVAGLERERLRGFAEQLLTRQDVLEPDRLAPIVAEAFVDEREAAAVTAALRNISPNAQEKVISMVARWRERSAVNADRFPADHLAQLSEKLSLLIHSYPALERGRKVRRLRYATGNDVLDADFVCDLRPVFAESTDGTPDGVPHLLPLVTFQISYMTADGKQKLFEANLDAPAMEQLVDRLDRCRAKVVALGDAVATWPVELLDDTTTEAV